ncbi:MAG: DNA repair protein RecO [Patescibacteria group bacterium]|jgi:DNA repair protein RecO (recombination protein O)|nr:DNA repair protein RecO [Patescibacteria group bacterium]
MADSFTTSAIILNSKPYKEADAIISVYTEDIGRLELVARGIQKQGSKLAGHLEILVRSKIMIIKGKGFDYLSAAVIENSFLKLREDYDKVICVQEVVRLFLSLTKENVEDKRLFSLLDTYLRTINDEVDFSEEKSLLYKLRFSLSLLKETGYLPELYNCVSCKKKIIEGNNYFNLLSGGVLCQNCYQNKKRNEWENLNNLLTISNNCIIVLRYFLDNKITKKIVLSKKVIKEAYKTINNFIIYIK